MNHHPRLQGSCLGVEVDWIWQDVHLLKNGIGDECAFK